MLIIIISITQVSNNNLFSLLLLAAKISQRQDWDEFAPTEPMLIDAGLFVFFSLFAQEGLGHIIVPIAGLKRPGNLAGVPPLSKRQTP